MFQLIYTSTPTVKFTPAQLREIAASARTTNHAINVTGILLMTDDYALQVLEGDEADVRALYGRIVKHPNHTDCEILLTRHCKARSFPESSLAYFNMDEKNAGEIKLLIAALRERRAARAKFDKLAS